MVLQAGLEQQSRMDPAEVPVEPVPPCTSQRERRPPTYLSDYVVANLPSTGQTHTTEKPHSTKSSRSWTTRSSQCSSYSRSTRSSRTSIGMYPSNVLSELENAQLEERVREMELLELQQDIEEDRQIEYERQRLQTKAREAQQLQEEALRAQELLTRQLERQRQLNRRAKELEIAKMATSLLQDKTRNPDGARASPLPDSSTMDDLVFPPAGTFAQPTVAMHPKALSTITAAAPPVPVHVTTASVSVTPLSATVPPSPTTLAPLPVSLAPPLIPNPSLLSVPPAAPLPRGPSPHPLLHLAPPPVSSAQPPASLVQPPVSRAVMPSAVLPQPSVIAAAPAVRVTGPPAHRSSPPLPPPASHPVEYPPVPPWRQPAGPLVPWYSAVPSGNYNHVSSSSASHPAQAYLSRTSPGHPAPVTMCSTSALPLPTLQPPAADAFPFIGTSYGVPKPMIPNFESGRESDFALLKMALDNLLNSHMHLSEQYKYQVLLGHLKLQSALQLAKTYMHDPRPYTTCRLYMTSTGSLVSSFKVN